MSNISLNSQKIDHDKSNDLIKVEESVFSSSTQEISKKPLLNSPFVQNFVDSFKKAEEDTSTDKVCDLEVSPSQQIAGFGKTTELQAKIKPRHVFLIQLGSGIGTGLLVGNGDALAQAGPAGLLIGYIVVSTFVYCTMNAISELGISYTSLSGSYQEFSGILIDRAFGFSVATIYCLQWLCALPLELTTSSMVIRYWTTKVNADIFVAIFFVMLLIVNFIGGQGYAEFEFVANTIKMLMILGFIIYGIITDVGGSSANNYEYIGGKYWHSPFGAFYGNTAMDNFKGICSSFIYAGFAYGGCEISVMTAAEQTRPRQAIVKAGKMLLYRIVIVYCTTVLIIGLLVPYTSSKLLGNGISTTSASPLVIAATNVTALPHIINAVILFSVLSVANSCIYCASRVMLSICEQFFPSAPYVTYVDRRGRPLVGLCLGGLFGCIAFAAASKNEALVFDWLLSISGLSALFTFLSMNVSFVRFRKAMKAQGRSLNEMAYISKTGVIGAYYSIILIILILIAQFWIALVPIGSNKPNATSFFQNYLAMVLFVILYFGFKIVTKEWHLFIKPEDVNLTRGRRIFDHDLIEQEKLEEKERYKNASFWVKVREFFF